jgi:hypothetical protein
MPPASRSGQAAGGDRRAATSFEEREEQRRLNTRTLGIASIASATAAAVTSQLWIAGTWVAAALTPVLVALISEAMHRPTERIARAWTSGREEPAARSQTATRAEPTAVTGTAGPVRVYRQTTRGAEPTRRGAAARTTLERPATLSRRRIAIGGVAVTALIAFAIAVVTITAGDLVTGGSIGKGSSRTTFFSGKKSDGQEQQPAPAEEDTTQPSQPDETQTQTETAPPEEEPTPSDTAPAPTPTTTAPSGQPPDTPTSP